MEHKFVVLLSQAHDEITFHILEGFQAKLEAIGARISCDIFYVPTPYQLPHAIRQLSTDSAYRGIVVMACFLGSEMAHAPVVLDHCLTESARQGVPLLPAFVEAEDVSAARDHVFGPKAKQGYVVAEQLIDLLSFLADVRGQVSN